MQLYSTITKRLETVRLEKDLNLYLCGPTVYDHLHVGNVRGLFVLDVLKRTLAQEGGRKITVISNITNIDDKIIEKAKLSGITPKAVANRYTTHYLRLLHDLRLEDLIDELPEVTGSMDAIQAVVQRLLASGHAYQTETGVYFRVKSYDNYGRLSGRATGEDGQEDFALWKLVKDPWGYTSPWGYGRPGWHVECSGMIHEQLKDVPVDIHLGGIDLKFPHHENECAQSHCAFPNQEFVRHWLHVGQVTQKNQKMSKSLRNSFRVIDVLDSGITPNQLRYSLLSTHYSKPLEWSSKLEETKRVVAKFEKAAARLLAVDYAEQDELFLQALRLDLKFPLAFARLHELSKREGDHSKFYNAYRLLGFL